MEGEINYLQNNNTDCEIEIAGKKQRASVSVDPNNSSPTVGNARLGLLRPASDTGLPGGNLNMNGNYSVANKDFYIEALSGERLAVKRVIVHIHVDTADIKPNTYGNVPELTNGIILFQKYKGIILNVLDGLPLRKQEDWGRICFDAVPVGPYGPMSRTPFWQVRLSFDKFVDSKYGIILEEGEQLGLRLQDDLTYGGTDPILEHYAYFEGVHLGTPNPAWQNVIAPL